MLMVNNLIGFAAAEGAVAASFVWTDAFNDSSGLTTLTFGGRNFAIGTASADRQIVVGVSAPRVGGTGGTITSVTIGGVAATKIIGVNNTGGGNTSRTEMWVATVPTGTTATISVVVNSGGAGYIEVAALYSASTATPTGSNIGSSIASPGTASIDVPANGVAIAFAIDPIGTTAFSWANLTERDDRVFGIAGLSMAADAFVAAQTGLAPTATYTSAAVPVFVCAAWGPA